MLKGHTSKVCPDVTRKGDTATSEFEKMRSGRNVWVSQEKGPVGEI